MKSLVRLAILPILLLAVLLQANAVVRSLVMQAGLGMGGTPMCVTRMGPMAGPDAPAPASASDHAPGAPHCPFCEVAAHVPVFVAAAPIPVATAVAFITFETVDAPAPPALHPILARARDPPPSV